MATTAASITSDISWIMQDGRLDRHPDFRVQTKRVGDSFVTVIYHADANGAREALAAYAANTPGIKVGTREHDGFLTVTQPAH